MAYVLIKDIESYKIHVGTPNEHSVQARAPHTNGPRDMPRCGTLSLLQKPLYYRGFRRNRARPLYSEPCLNPVVANARVLVHEVLDRGTQAAVRGGARCASQEFDRGAQADARGTAQVLDRGAQAVARGAAR